MRLGPKELVSEIRTYCEAHEDPKKAQAVGRYFREGYEAWGLLDKEHPLWNEKEPEWAERYARLGLKGFFAAGELLFAGGKYEEGALAIHFIRRLQDQLDAGALPRFAAWFDAGIRNWAHTDVLCGEILSPLLAEGRISLSDIAPWIQSEKKYQRRAVPVTMLALLKQDPPVEPLLKFVEPLMMDPERVVHQGTGWFLREAWKKQPKPVERFLMKWKDQAPRLIFQYATEKMTPEARARFRRAKTAKAKA
jgi:3-methyladenine DNA glycosylase AlkD